MSRKHNSVGSYKDNDMRDLNPGLHASPHLKYVSHIQ